MEWIRVEDRKPQDGQRVLAVVTGWGIDPSRKTNKIVMAIYKWTEWYYENPWLWEVEVTHWMPLPEPPEGVDIL